MPKRTDIHTILVPGSGPIVIGQAAEFDYSGTQAVKALRAEGYRVVLVNSNPATIMTDPELADATYIEPLTPEALEAIIAQEQPDALLPTVGGQTGLNLALALSENGALEKYGVQLIGATLQRDPNSPRTASCSARPCRRPASRCRAAARRIRWTKREALADGNRLSAAGARLVCAGRQRRVVGELPPRTCPRRCARPVAVSPIGQAWLEESVLGWKEYELEVMRDRADNFVVVCTHRKPRPDGRAHRRQHHRRARRRRSPTANTRSCATWRGG